MKATRRDKRSILLLECHIAGIAYQHLSEIAESLSIGDKLVLKREHNNKYDYFAISVWDAKNNKIGFIPKNQNIILARLMDADKIFQSFIIENKCENNYIYLKIRIFLLD